MSLVPCVFRQSFFWSLKNIHSIATQILMPQILKPQISPENKPQNTPSATQVKGREDKSTIHALALQCMKVIRLIEFQLKEDYVPGYRESQTLSLSHVLRRSTWIQSRWLMLSLGEKEVMLMGNFEDLVEITTSSSTKGVTFGGQGHI